MNTGLMFSSKTDLWATPQAFFDELNKEFDFNLDPCALPDNAKCQTYFTPNDDGLSISWFDYVTAQGNSPVVFMNPPYGDAIKFWIEKAYHESKVGCTVVGLLPARTDTRYFHEYIYGKAEIRFVKGRLKFGNSKQSAPFPSMIVVWKPDNQIQKQVA